MTLDAAVLVVEEFLESELEHRQLSMLPKTDLYISSAMKAIRAFGVVRAKVQGGEPVTK